jgi:cyclopropane fatty-acyl-phospholipid synthase-like methyltransferase
VASERPKTNGIVASGYDAAADRYEALEHDDRPWPRMRWLADLLALLDDDSRVLEVGCGNGVPATRAIARRHRVTGIDLSAEQVARARRNVPNADVRQGDFMEVSLEGPFDAIAAFYVIDHLPRELHGAVFRRLRTLLRPSGHLLFTVEPEDEPGGVRDWLGVPMFFSQYDAAETLALVREAGFDVVRHSVESQLEGDHEVAYLWVLARRSES